MYKVSRMRARRMFGHPPTASSQGGGETFPHPVKREEEKLRKLRNNPVKSRVVRTKSSIPEDREGQDR